MRLFIIAVLCLVFSVQANAANLKKGAKMNKTCALCHGAWGQGTTGAKSPRIAGMTRGFLVRILSEYRSKKRKNAGMVLTSGIHRMSDKNIDDVSTYLAGIDLRGDPRFDVDHAKGDKAKGRKIFMSECKGCHKKTGYGKPKKGIPALAGQQTAYIIRTIERFKARKRIHDDDPEDDLFDEMFPKKQDMMDLTAFLSTLDDIKEQRVATLPDGSQILGKRKAKTKVKAAVKATKVAKAPTEEDVPGASVNEITQTVAKMQLEVGITKEDAITAMRSRAVELNMKLVGEQHVSKALKDRGEKAPYLAIFQFCNLSDAKTIITNNPLYAAYMPCRVAMVEDPEGRIWLMMLNLDILVDNTMVSKKVVETVINVNQKMLEIMVAGANGAF
ncbi:MAG: c-type cytochrome [Hyphomicrobiaceae bacterium]|nr:c-type cytochrome [Hyphomicrobiaceae bacterium]